MNLFEFEDYKKAVNCLVSEKRKTNKGLSRKMAEHLGVHPTMISQVLSGYKNFTEEQMVSVCEFLGTSKLESHYLLVLLQHERAGSKKLKDYFKELKDQTRKQALQLSKRVRKDRELTDSEKSTFYSSWIYSAVHLLTTLEKEIRFEDVCRKLNLPSSRAREILDFLIGIQMIQAKDGVFKPGAVATHLEKTSPYLVRHHANWRLKAIQASENLTDQELMYTANFSVSQKDFEALREELVKTIQKFLAIVGPSEAADIAQFNLDLFWIRP